MIRKSSLLPGHFPEDEFKVKSVRQYLPASKQEGRKRALVQFHCAETGGQYTICAADIVKIR